MQTPVLLVVAVLVAGACALPAQSLWTGSSMDAVVGELRTACEEGLDAVACAKHKVLSLVDHALVKDSFQVSEGVSVVRNSAKGAQPEDGQGDSQGRGLLDSLEKYVREHDLVVRLPGALGAQSLAISARNLDHDELTLAVRSQDTQEDESDAQVEGKSRKRRKNKLKKILIPILVFVLLKAMTLIPLALGVLGLKAWNALQLSFFSFLISISLAMFQLFKKIASDSPPPAAIHAAPWQDYSQYAAARTLLVDQQQAAAEDAHQLAYNAYTNN